MINLVAGASSSGKTRVFGTRIRRFESSRPSQKFLIRTQIKADFYLQTHSTNPLLKAETLSRAIQAFVPTYPDRDSLFSVTRLQTRLYDRSGRALNHDPSELIQTQDLPPVYEENSCLYMFTRQKLEQRHHRIGERPLMYEISRFEAVDIDEYGALLIRKDNGRIERVIAGPERKSRLISEDEKRVVAYHEAGHAVAYFVYGLDFDYVSIMPEQIEGISLNGVVRRLSPVHSLPRSPEDVDLYVSRVINALYAGGISASLYASGPNLSASNASDECKIKNLCEKRDNWKCKFPVGPKGDLYLKQRYQETLELMISHARLIDAVARALLLKQKLLHNDVAELYYAWKDEESTLFDPKAP